MVHLNMGVTYYKMGDLQTSFRHLKKSLRIGQKGKWTHRQCFANIALGNVYRMTRDFATARKHLHKAYNQAQELQFPREEALALEFLGDVFRDEGRPDEARRYYARALAIGDRIAPEGDIVMEVQRRIGECHFLEDNTTKAIAPLNRALVMSRKQGDRYEEAVTLRVLSSVSYRVGDQASARRYADQSLGILEEIGANHERAISLMHSSQLMLSGIDQESDVGRRLNQLNIAWEQATRALDLFLKADVPWWAERCRSLVDRISTRRAQASDGREVASKRSGDRGVTVVESVEPIIHTSRVMQDLLQLCDMFAGYEEPVLVTGETGTGKELLARRIHRLSSRHDKPMVTVNVAAIPQTMFEREFFGHVRGAFTGADKSSEGFAGRADGGTLFLDEIGDLPLEVQPKLLRLLQEGTYQAIGDPSERRTDIRLVAATNGDLQKLVTDGLFRSDLYYRIKILDLELPPVRERRDDVLPLLRHFLSLAAGRPVEVTDYFNRSSIEAIDSHSWPGNVREIAMVARRAHMDLKSRGRVEVALHDVDGVKLVVTGPGKTAVVDSPAAELALTPTEMAEKSRILLALEANGGQRIQAARSLGIGRSTLYRRMEKLGIPTRRI